MLTMKKRRTIMLGGVALAAVATFAAAPIANATGATHASSYSATASLVEHPTWTAFRPQVFHKGFAYANKHSAWKFLRNGNLIVQNSQGNTMWDSDTRGVGEYVIFEPNGDLIVYAADHRIAWESHTGGNPGATLWLTDNGHLTIFTKAGVRVWISPGIW